MNRQSPYHDVNTVPYANNAQLHQMPAQRMHQGSGINTPMGRADSFPAEHDHYYASQVQLDANARYRGSALFHPYHETSHELTQRNNTAGNLHRQQISDSTTLLQNAGHIERPESQEQDMEIGYEDNPAPLNFQALEKKFQDETLNLLKEQVDAEDAEIIRHKEKIIEISNQYQEKLSTLRSQQAKQREEFLQKESEARIQSYQQQSVISCVPSKVGLNDDHGYIPEARKVGPINNHGSIDSHGYIPEAITCHLARKIAPIDSHVYVPAEPNGPDPHRGYSAVQFHDQHLDRPAIHAADKNQRASGRVPMPYGRVYNNKGAGV